MAFEIYNGNGTTNDIIDKIIEMWDFDSYDQESSYHSATYGNGKITAQNNGLVIQTVTGTNIGDLPSYSTSDFKIIKTENSIMISILYYNEYYAAIIGNLAGPNTNKNKGICVINSYKVYSVMGEDANQSYIQITPATSDTLVQLIPIAATKYGDYYFRNAYRIIISPFANTMAIEGKYLINNNTYYISGGLAIKEE